MEYSLNYIKYSAMKIRSLSWSETERGPQELIVGEFAEVADYRVQRPSGTANYLLIQTVAGAGRILGPGGEELLTGPGQLILFEPASFHDYGTSPRAGKWNLLWCHFMPLQGGPERWNLWETPWAGIRTTQLGPLPSQRVADEFRELLGLPLGSGQEGGKFALLTLERIFLRVAHALSREPGNQPDSRLHPALVHVQNHLSRAISVESLARACGLSASRFAHLFKAETGVTPQSFVEGQRMELARTLLRYADLPVGEVARHCGFENPLYFSTRFRHAHGLSPRQFRNEKA